MIEPNQQKQDQWIVVTKNKNKHKGSMKNKNILNKGNLHFFSANKVEEEALKFTESPQYRKNKEILKKAISKVLGSQINKKVHVQCLGIGSFNNNRKSFIQLTYLQKVILNSQILKKQPLQKDLNEVTINLYDPILNETEINYAKKLNMSCIKQFEIKNNQLNIFFMPHCERDLYQLVFQNYKQKISLDSEYLSSSPLIVIGNSIQSYKQRCRLTKQKIPEIFESIYLIEETIIDHQQALNDTCIIYFDTKKYTPHKNI